MRIALVPLDSWLQSNNVTQSGANKGTHRRIGELLLDFSPAGFPQTAAQSFVGCQISHPAHRALDVRFSPPLTSFVRSEILPKLLDLKVHTSCAVLIHEIYVA